jgi:hypothetical protein
MVRPIERTSCPATIATSSKLIKSYSHVMSHLGGVVDGICVARVIKTDIEADVFLMLWNVTPTKKSRLVHDRIC